MTIAIPAAQQPDPEVNTLVEQLRAECLPPPTARRAIRRAAGFTLEDVAAHVGVDIMSISRWERGLAKPRKQHREAYGRILAALAVIAAERTFEQTQK